MCSIVRLVMCSCSMFSVKKKKNKKRNISCFCHTKAKIHMYYKKANCKTQSADVVGKFQCSSQAPRQQATGWPVWNFKKSKTRSWKRILVTVFLKLSPHIPFQLLVTAICLFCFCRPWPFYKRRLLILRNFLDVKKDWHSSLFPRYVLPISLIYFRNVLNWRIC